MKTPRWNELKRLNQSLKATRWNKYRRLLGVALTQYARVSGDSSLLGYLRNKDYPRLYAAADALAAQKYADATLHFVAHQVAALIRKYPWDPKAVCLDPEATALRGFLASEHRCKWMNRWATAVYRRDGDRKDTSLRKMRAFIRSVIGSRPDYSSIFDKCDFSAGASIGVTGNATNLGRKLLAERWTVTPSALPLFAAALGRHYHYATKVACGNGQIQSFYVGENDMKESCKLVDYNKVAFVAKTAKTHRSIAVEPLGNGFLQKGVDEFMRLRLRRIGLDLRDQSLNQRLAREGSLTDSEEGFCTIDLSSASDSLAVGVVKLLLPPAWFAFLDRVRSPSYLLPGGQQTRYEKFCSMGNGFCFPLETLIFAAACHAVTGGVPGKDWVVYGDDIIVRRKAFNGVTSLLKRIGFKTNVRKTFAEGPFRESCGSNWFNGEDVTPFTLDWELDSLSSLFKAINLCRRNSRTEMFFREWYGELISAIPEPWRFFRPFAGPSDTAIDFRDVQFKPNWGWKKSFQCPVWFELRATPVKDKLMDSPPGWVVMAAALRGSPSERPFVVRRMFETRVRAIARSGNDVTCSIQETGMVPGFRDLAARGRKAPV